MFPDIYNKRDKTNQQVYEGKCDTETRRCIGIAKEALQKLNKILRKRKFSIEINKGKNC